MTDVYRAHAGSMPLLVSVPHDGRLLPELVRERMTATGRDLADTDWHVARLYEFAQAADASFVIANYSRYVVDLNRPPDDAALYAGHVATGICPTQSFAGDNLYFDGVVVDLDERQARVRSFWQPYHEHIQSTLDALRDKHGYALLWDAHSIPSKVPRLFEGELPVLNIGTNDGASCAPEVAAAVNAAAEASPYTSVENGRFKGGYITRHYGSPAEHVHAVQLEIAQRAYMDEDSREFDVTNAATLQGTLSALLSAFMESGAKSRP